MASENEEQQIDLAVDNFVQNIELMLSRDCNVPLSEQCWMAKEAKLVRCGFIKGLEHAIKILTGKTPIHSGNHVLSSITGEQ